jgi:predicted amidohydrolase
MKVSLVQTNPGDNLTLNSELAQKHFIAAANDGADVVCLPECFLYRGDQELVNALDINSEVIKSWQNLARDRKVNLILGSILLKTETPNKVSNTSLVIDRSGQIIYRYDKIYMYDVLRPDLTYRESDTVRPGKEFGFFELENIKMGVGICVDLRYPEYFRQLIKAGAEVIFLPSTFRQATGALAWDVLTQARALENQVYFCACDQTGGEGNKKRCGHTRIIGFDGQILAQLDRGEGIVSANLDLEAERQFREQFPVLKQIK